MEKVIKAILSANVYDVAIQTPLQHAQSLSRRLQNDILLKREDLQPVFSFKLRGAYNRMAALSPEAAPSGSAVVRLSFMEIPIMMPQPLPNSW